MSDIHVLNSSGPGRFRIVYHIPIPAGNNSAGVSWRAAVARSKVNQVSPTVLPDGDGAGGTISATEKALIVSGEIYEFVHEEKGQTQNTITAMFARRSAETIARLQGELGQYGRVI